MTADGARTAPAWMFDGDWREKVRYILWTNGQRRDRAIRAAVSAGLSPRDALPA